MTPVEGETVRQYGVRRADGSVLPIHINYARPILEAARYASEFGGALVARSAVACSKSLHGAAGTGNWVDVR